MCSLMYCHEFVVSVNSYWHGVGHENERLSIINCIGPGKRHHEWERDDVQGLFASQVRMLPRLLLAHDLVILEASISESLEVDVHMTNDVTDVAHLGPPPLKSLARNSR